MTARRMPGWPWCSVRSAMEGKMKPTSASGSTNQPACSADSGSRCSNAKPLMVIRQKLSSTTVDHVCERNSQTINGPAHKARKPRVKNHSDDRLAGIAILRVDNTRRQTRTSVAQQPAQS